LAGRAADVADAPVYLVRGDDPSLVRDRVAALLDELVGQADRSLMVEEVEVDAASAAERAAQLAAIVDAAQTPPFLTERRIVVGRGLHHARAEELDGLTAAIDDLLPSTVLILVWEGGSVPKRLLDRLKAAGGPQLDTSPGRNARAQRQWLTDQTKAAGVRLDPAAMELVADRLGEDLGRLGGVLTTLAATYGAGATLGPGDVEPYLGAGGALAPYELTDAIDRGAIDVALDRLHRLLRGERHPLQLMATLHGHYARMLALDGSGVRSESDAAALLGMRGSTYPARKALDQSRRLGSAHISQAIGLLAQADLDLRGAKGWPDALVMEVLVARLANLSR
jgi:DNA polymerase III subunit delta